MPAALLLAALTRVMFFFDTEDFTCNRSNDAIRDLAVLMTEEGVCGEFNVVGYLARELQRLNRRDVIEVLKPHAIGTQTLWHSMHPTVCELSDMPDYAVAYRNVFETESEGVGIPKRTFGLKAVDYAVPREQLGLFRHCPGLECVDLKKHCCIHSPTLNAALPEERFQLQLWTLRYDGGGEEGGGEPWTT